MPIGGVRAGYLSGVKDAIPDSVVVQQFATAYSAGDSTWADDATSDGSQGMTINGDPQDGTLSDGSESVVFDGGGDYGATDLPASLEGSGLQSFSVEYALQTTTSDFDRLGDLRNDDANQRFLVRANVDETGSGNDGYFVVQLTDDAGSSFQFAPSNNPNINDGNRHDISVIIDDSTNNNATLIIDGSSVSVTVGSSDSPSSFTTWDHSFPTAARNLGGSVDSYLSVEIGAVRWHDTAISNQTISDYPQ